MSTARRELAAAKRTMKVLSGRMASEGFFRLDCRGIDPGCTNESWHSPAHVMNNRFPSGAIIAAPLILAFAFRRIPEWRSAWLPSLLAVPASIVCGLLCRLASRCGQPPSGRLSAANEYRTR